MKVTTTIAIPIISSFVALGFGIVALQRRDPILLLAALAIIILTTSVTQDEQPHAEE